MGRVLLCNHTTCHHGLLASQRFHHAAQARPANGTVLSHGMHACSCCGLLRVRRLPALNTLARPLPPSALFLLRHKRRRLAIEELQASKHVLALELSPAYEAAALPVERACMQV